jgi:hypothetical protein
MRVDGDILFFRWVDDFAPGEVNALQSRMEGMLGEHDFIFLLVDATLARSIEPEARRRAASWPHFQRLGGAAIFGAGLTMRTLVTITLAISRRIFFQSKTMPVVEFVHTEEAARAWIEARRREILSTGNPPR